MLPNYYKILGLNKNSSAPEIKKRYRLLALQYHPDRNKASDAHERFIAISEAYVILSDGHSRAKYDVQYSILYEKWVGDSNYQGADAANMEDWVRNARSQAESYAAMSFRKFSEFVSEVGSEVGFQLKQMTIFALSGVIGLSVFMSVIWLISGIFRGSYLLAAALVVVGFIAVKFASHNWGWRK